MLPPAIGFRGLALSTWGQPASTVQAAKLPQLPDFNLLIREPLVLLLTPHQLKRIRHHGRALFYTGNQIRTPKPVRLSQIRRRPPRRMIRMRMVEPNNVLAALPSLALNANQFFGVDVVPVLWRVFPSISAARHRCDRSGVAIHLPQQHTTALVRIGFLTMPPKGIAL